MRDLDLKTLRLLVAVCDHRNIKHAAQQEHIEPSAISKRLAQLEQTLGIAVLTRGRHGAEPTAAGRALLEHARSILFTVDRIESDMAAFKGGIKGQVRVAASASAIAEVLLDDLTEFMRVDAHRDIRVDIEERFSRDIVRMVREGTTSLGICWDQVDATGLSSVPYREDELVLAVPEGHRLGARESLWFEETLDEEHIGLQSSASVTTMLHKAALKAGRTPSYRVIVSNFDATFRVVAAGLGVSVVPRQVSSVYTRAGGIAVVALRDAWARRRFGVFYRTRDELTPAAAKLVDFLTAQAVQAAPDGDASSAPH